MTGIAMLTIDLGGKRLELLSQLVPNASLIGFLVNLNNPNVGGYVAANAKCSARNG